MTPLALLLPFFAINAVLGGAYLVHRRQKQTSDTREVADKEHDKAVERIRETGIGQYLLMMRQHYQGLVNPLIELRGEHQAARIRLEQLRERIRKQIWRDGNWSISFVVVAFLLGAAWLVLFLILRSLDIQLLYALGYGSGQGGSSAALGQLLGTTIALGITVIGIIISGLVGLHSLLPSWLNLSRFARRTLAINLALVAVLAAGAMAFVAPYRAQSAIGPQVTRLQASLVEQENTSGSDPTEKQATELQLAQAQQRLHAAETLDRTLAVCVPLLELLVSPAPIYVAELLVFFGLGVPIRSRARHYARLTREINRINDQFAEEMTDIAHEAGVNIEEVLEFLNRPPELPPGPSDSPQLDGQGSSPAGGEHATAENPSGASSTEPEGPSSPEDDPPPSASLSPASQPPPQPPAPDHTLAEGPDPFSIA